MCIVCNVSVVFLRHSVVVLIIQKFDYFACSVRKRLLATTHPQERGGLENLSLIMASTINATLRRLILALILMIHMIYGSSKSVRWLLKRSNQVKTSIFGACISGFKPNRQNIYTCIIRPWCCIA